MPGTGRCLGTKERKAASGCAAPSAEDSAGTEAQLLQSQAGRHQALSLGFASQALPPLQSRGLKDIGKKGLNTKP